MFFFICYNFENPKGRIMAESSFLDSITPDFVKNMQNRTEKIDSAIEGIKSTKNNPVDKAAKAKAAEAAKTKAATDKIAAEKKAGLEAKGLTD